MGKKILVVEDNAITMKLVETVLSKAGYEVRQAVNAFEAVPIVYKEFPDLILMDINLPGLNGLEAMKTINDGSHAEHIKIVALTALAMPGDREKMLAAGFDGYVPKPINFQELLATMESLLK